MRSITCNQSRGGAWGKTELRDAGYSTSRAPAPGPNRVQLLRASHAAARPPVRSAASVPHLHARKPAPRTRPHLSRCSLGPLLCRHQPHLLVPAPSPDAAPQRASLLRRAIRAAASFRALHRSLTQLRAAPGAAPAHFRSAAARVPEPAPRLHWLPPPAVLALLACSSARAARRPRQRAEPPRASRSPAPEPGAASSTPVCASCAAPPGAAPSQAAAARRAAAARPASGSPSLERPPPVLRRGACAEERKGGRRGSAQKCDTDGEREGKMELDRAAAGGEGDKGARGEGAEGVVTRGNFAAGGGKNGRHSGGLQSRNRAAPEEEEKGNFPRTYL
ncbi:hypothetical protein GQ55_4G202100 [Panicum hallii var. hallii]|uniref:Uncharacterized protein n=1 Tax=Panicum hallii var. hallii TaxID=1504633 RepID=A0A2T7DZ60_9POAL|nr:hypothetical protein GQ55_4G202100 [Panicum hallii var. hallii]